MNNPVSIDTFIAEQIQAQSTIAVNRIMGVTIRPLIKDIFDGELNDKVQKAVDDAVANYVEDVDLSEHICTGSVEDAVSLHLENNVDIDSLVEDAVADRTDNRLYEMINDAVSELDTDNIVSDSRIEEAVESALPAAVESALPLAVADYMGENLSNFFRSPDGEQVLSDFVTSHAGRTALARTFMTLLLEHSHA